MELALSLGDHPSKPFSFLDKTPKLSSKELGFRLGEGDAKRVSSDPPLQFDLLPFTRVPRSLPWLPVVAVADEAEDGAALSSPNSAASSFQMDFGFKNGSKRGSDDDDKNGSTRKKLRLSKEQSAFLEESFKEHNTLNPKQKLALAKQLNLRPRQIEVWFQNRRARTKLKQTEVDCEYLKRYCETMAGENKRLQKELHELRALKTSQPFYMQLPATTLTMCPSCERVATVSTTTNASVSAVTACDSSNEVKTEGYQFFCSSTNT